MSVVGKMGEPFQYERVRVRGMSGERGQDEQVSAYGTGECLRAGKQRTHKEK